MVHGKSFIFGVMCIPRYFINLEVDLKGMSVVLYSVVGRVSDLVQLMD